MSERHLQKRVHGVETADGAGVRLKRIIGQGALDSLDPFLLLDEFRSDRPDDYLAGFPEHPHRGFETVTYMLAGHMRHGDNHGHRGDLGPGSVQWMTAGRGIVHSEMPQQEAGLLWGFQLWVNLPARDKLTAPRYQDIPAERIPHVEPAPGVTVRVIAGTFGDAVGPALGIATAPVYLDVALGAGTRLDVPLPATHNAFVYLFDGTTVAVGGEPLRHGELGVLSAGTRVALTAAASPARLLVVAGRPLGEPVARYGPFVMNTPAEIREAIADLRAGRF
ncbi:MAG: pirin family protein [Fulvimonas sp.]|nr:pirin family protein [Fulvimonas sp.]